MTDLPERQQQLLKCIVELYVKTGEPVSSEILEKTYDLGVSPATIRNEMVKLTESGFLKQPHTSAGRTPTAIAFRFYISNIMEEKDVPVIEEVAIRQQLMDKNERLDYVVQEATRALSKKCGTLAMAVTHGNVYYTGAAYILDLPEFYDIDVTRFVLSLFDEHSLLEQILNTAQGSEDLHIIFGEETDFEYLYPTSFAFIEFGADQKEGIIGIIGPNRLNFPVVFPYLRYVAGILSEVSHR